MKIFLLVFATFLAGAAWADNVIVKFDPSAPAIGPFPTDNLTVTDLAQKTGLRVHLPMPDCTAQPSDCSDITALNELDGFHLQPRISVSFSGAIDPATIKPGVLIVWLDNRNNEETGLGPSGQISALNQIVYDPATNTAYAQPDDALDQHRHYALIVTDAVLDATGNPIAPDPKFTACVQSPQSDYCTQLQQAIGKLARAALPGNIVSASLFTTMSATAWLEKARVMLPQTQLAFHSSGASVKLAEVSAMNLQFQVTTNPVTFQPLSIPIPLSTLLAGVDRIVFGTYQSPNFLNAQQYIPSTPTSIANDPPTGTSTISFHAYIPSSPMPANGYPVIIFGHGLGDNSFASPSLVASTFAKAGFATLAINAAGHGGGPQSNVKFTKADNTTVEFLLGGRSIDLDGNGHIDDSEGCIIALPYPVGLRDCLRQTVVDLLQLTNLIRSGTPIEPSGALKLDGDRIYYSGISLGGMYGTIFSAVANNVKAAVLNSGGGSPTDIARWSPSYRGLLQQSLAAHVPSLLNVPPNFDENYVLRDQPVKVNTVPGAIDIQNFLGQLNWLQAAGDPLTYSPHLNLTPLANVTAKPALFQYALGDQTVPNPQASALIRGAGAFASSTLYRADVAASVAKSLGQTISSNPHAFLVDITSLASELVAVAAQQQVAGFLASDGKTIPDPNAVIRQLLPITTDIFETPGHNIESTSTAPTIHSVASATGVRASIQPSVQAGSWVAVYGAYLANTTTDWTGLISNGQLPTSLAGVGVTFGGKPAYVYFVSPGQIDVQAPAVAVGDVEVVVTNNGAASAPMKVHVANYAPAFFQWGASKYAVATRFPDNALVANPSLGAGFVAARPGDTLILWGTGFGPTTPPQSPGVLVDGTHTVAQPVTVTVGALSATVIGAALSPGLVGVYQIAIQLPSATPLGDVVVKASVGGSNTPDNVAIFVAQ